MSSTQEAGEIFGQGRGPAHAMLRSPTVLIASVGLWGMNIFFFRLFGIDYVKVLKYDLLRLENREDNGSPPSTGNVSNPKWSRKVASTELVSTNTESTGFLTDDDEEDDSYSNSDGYEDMNGAITWDRLVVLSISLLLILHSTYYVWIDVLDRGSLGAIFAFYSAVTAAIMVPLPTTRWLRRATAIVLKRSYTLIHPRCSCVIQEPSGPRPIPFIDVFFADAMCSLSKVFFDWGMLLHMAFHYPRPVPASAYNIVIPSAFAAVPYVIRARQCLIMYNVTRIKNDPNRFQHLWNALKYSTSIFPLCLSAYQKTIDPLKAQGLEIYLILLLAINALYALYWDIVMDWGMMKSPAAAVTSTLCGGGVSDQPRAPSCGHAVLRPRLRFGVAMSALILVTDVILRFSWLLRFYHDLFPSADTFVLCTQFLEVFRRALWNLLRVEWENLKQLKPPPDFLAAKAVDEETTSFIHSKPKVAIA